MSGIYTIEDLREKGLEEPLVRIPFKISCRESAEVWISAGKSFRLKQSMQSECTGSLKISNNFDTLSLWSFHIVWQPMFAFSFPFTRFDSRHLFRDFGWCPYYAARRLIHAASVVVLNYQHLASKSLNLVPVFKSIVLFQLCTFVGPVFLVNFLSSHCVRYVLDPKVSLASSLGGAPSLPGARRQGSAIVMKHVDSTRDSKIQ